MTPVQLGLLGIIILLILIILRTPIGVAMAVVGFAGFAYLTNIGIGIGVLRVITFSTFASYDLSVIPLFILMGTFCFNAGLSADLYFAANKWIGQIKGGLAIASVGACAAFAAVCGSSIATALTIGKVSIAEMKRYNYYDTLSTGCVAAGGTIGILIPPSIPLVLYGIITEQSIGKLFMAGFIPGVLQALFYMVTIYIMCKRNPNMGPAAPKIKFMQKVESLRNIWVILLLFVVIIGGIYLGVFSPTEAAGIGAFGAFIFALARRRLNWKAFRDSLFETGASTAMIFIILLGAYILGQFLAVSRLPFALADVVAGLSLNPYIILVLILLVYVLLGCFMEAVSMMLLITPIFYPIIVNLGFDPIWFGILVIRVVEIGMITPPVGMNAFVIKGVAQDVPLQTVFRGITPFLMADGLNMALLISIPQLSLLLPNLMVSFR